MMIVWRRPQEEVEGRRVFHAGDEIGRAARSTFAFFIRKGDHEGGLHSVLFSRSNALHLAIADELDRPLLNRFYIMLFWPNTLDLSPTRNLEGSVA